MTVVFPSRLDCCVASHWRRWCGALLLACSFSSALAASSITTQFTFIPASIAGDNRVSYDMLALKLALTKTIEEYGLFSLEFTPPMSKERALQRLRENHYPNAFRVFLPSVDFNADSRLRRVNFPVHLGLFSHRVCFIPRGLEARVAEIKHKAQLRDFSFGLGLGWEEVPIFEANRLKVTEVRLYDSLFKMTDAGRIDFFCRAIHEIHEESIRYAYLENLLIDRHISLHYPLPLLFYTHHDNARAAERLQLGFLKAFEDGSLHALWLSEYEDKINKIDLKSRKSFFLPNPLLDDLGFDYERYFYIPLPPH